MLGFFVCYSVSRGKLSALTSGYRRLSSVRASVDVRTTLSSWLLCHTLLSHMS